MAFSTKFSARPILVAVDLQPHSLRAIEYALSLASESNRSLLVLHVVHETAESAGFYRRHNRAHPTLPMSDIAADMLRKLLSEAAADTAAAAIETWVVEGIPANRIAEVAEQVDAQIIVMASGGRKGFDKFWHGSVTEGVRERAQRELVLLPPGVTAQPSTGVYSGTRFVQPAH